MSTNSSSASTATSLPLLLGEDIAAKLSVAFNFAIIPCLSAVGICGNVASMFLLTRQGFRRSSKVLLFALALADVLLLAGSNNFSRHVLAANFPVGLTFSESVNYMFYIFYILQAAAHEVGLYGSIFIPVLITGERLLVIFLPLKVHAIVTPLRTLVVILCVFALIILCFIYQYILWMGFEQTPMNGVLRGRLVATKRLDQDLTNGTYRLFQEFINCMTGAVPIVPVIIGCSVIALKITVITRRRRQLTSGGVTSKANLTSRPVLLKSTRTLLSICFLYILCTSFEFMIGYVSHIPYVHSERTIQIVFDSLNTFSQCINSVGNFVIYGAVNINFMYKNLRAGYCVKKS